MIVNNTSIFQSKPKNYKDSTEVKALPISFLWLDDLLLFFAKIIFNVGCKSVIF